MASERLTYRKEKLKMAQPLGGGTAGWSHADLGGSAGNQVLYCFIGAETDIARRVECVCQIHAHRAEGRLVADSKASGLNGIIGVGTGDGRNGRRFLRPIEEPGVRLRIGQGKVTEGGVNVAHIVEENTADVRTQKRKT